LTFALGINSRGDIVGAMTMRPAARMGISPAEREDTTAEDPIAAAGSSGMALG